MKKSRVAIVVQQCGTQIFAGAERYALNLGFALGSIADVEIFTSRSDDYATWNNNLAEFENLTSREGQQVRIRRFLVRGKRRLFLFSIYKRILFLFRFYLKPVYLIFHKFFDALFLRLQGPWCPELWKQLAIESQNFDLVIFKTYLYAPSFFGIQALHKKTPTLLIVTGHDEKPFYLCYVKTALTHATHIACVSAAERELVERVWPSVAHRKPILLPPGLKPLARTEAMPLRSNLPAPKSYFLVLGRVERAKNISFILKNAPGDVFVCLAGEVHMPTHDLGANAIVLGRVSEEEKHYLLRNCLAVVVASKLEAFSISTAEAIADGALVLALQGGEAIEELVKRYGGIISSEEEFSDWMKKIAAADPQIDGLRPKSEKALEELSWNASVAKIRDLLGARQIDNEPTNS